MELDDWEFTLMILVLCASEYPDARKLATGNHSRQWLFAGIGSPARDAEYTAFRSYGISAFPHRDLNDFRENFQDLSWRETGDQNSAK
jgi:hypothetical protein